MILKKALAGLTGLLFAFAAAPSMAVPVDLELQLLIDTSGSVDNAEYALQVEGYEDAFRDADIIAAIEAGDIGSIAVQLIFWSGSTSQAIGVDWTLITDAASANAFADLIAATVRPFGDLTAPGSALDFGAPLFNDNGFEGTRTVIDVSGDGAQNDGSLTSTARDAALAGGVDVINGLAILTDDPNLDDWYMANVIGGTGAFVVAASDFADFADAVREKIGREITGVIPVPGALPLMVTGIALLWARRRKKKAA